MRFATATLLSLPIFAAATTVDVAARNDDGGSQCSGGTINCCNSTQNSTALNLGTLSSLLGIQLPNIGALIGLTCTSIAALSALGQQCASQQVCCTNNSFNGLIALGCTAINL
ncbi:hypothetical protein D9619_001629 [Psilocybe cf. subviscida]|uniref:Hydrophobin n=1 Tax=Psilocybe cf. subviscida TaxID=2480587 RepID=A0A8H5F2H6_9AGAR|nr:hypothetical protein D9619_001629 [Psilocybe cf. subviscida]